VAAARVGEEDKEPEGGEQRRLKAARRPMRVVEVGGPAVDGDDQRVLLGGIVIARIDKPALDGETAVLPSQAFGFAPQRPLACIRLDDGAEGADEAGADFWRAGPVRLDIRGAAAVPRPGKVAEVSAVVDVLVGGPEQFAAAGGEVEVHKLAAAAGVLSEIEGMGRDPFERADRDVRARGTVELGAAGGGHGVQIAAGETFVAHQALDE